MLLACSTLCFSMAFSGAVNYGPTVTAPSRFDPGDFMTSNNTQYHAIMQPDGNFVIYRGTLADNPEDARWSTKTSGRSNGPYHIDLQDDNNFVLYDVYKLPLWSASKKAKGQPPATLYLTDDGNLILVDATGGRLWSSRGALVGRLGAGRPKKKNTGGW